MSDAEIASQVKNLEKMGDEFRSALKHCEIAKDHFSNKDVARACAHTFAVEGHLAVIKELLVEMAKLHRVKARLNP